MELKASLTVRMHWNAATNQIAILIVPSEAIEPRPEHSEIEAEAVKTLNTLTGALYRSLAVITMGQPTHRLEAAETQRRPGESDAAFEARLLKLSAAFFAREERKG